jgi:CubicO group peptidase (beta-lactamase class C family)
MKTVVSAHWLVAATCGFALVACGSGSITAPASSISEFEQRLEALRSSSHIPGISVVIANGQRIVWSKGFGNAELASTRLAEDTTVYHLASLTKPFASTVILELVDEGKISLDDPVSMYGIHLESPGVIRVRHLLSHTSEGTPGTNYSYNGDRYGLLDSVIAHGAGMSFAAALQQRIISHIGLTRTAPNPQSSSFAIAGLDRSTFEANLARGYTYTGNGYAPTAYPSYFGTAAGLTASALDVAAFSMAMDRDAFLRPETKALAYTAVMSPSGKIFPYGLGWFTTLYKGVRIIWHYGLWTANSSLIVKVPDRGFTFVVLANTDGLSQPYQLGIGKLDSSPWAREFLDDFVIGSLQLPTK